MKRMIALTLAASMAVCMTACGGSDNQTQTTSAAGSAEKTANTESDSGSSSNDYSSLEPVELILADSAAKGAAGSTFDDLVAQKVSEITGGKLTMDEHLNGDLGNDVDLIRQMQSGDIDIVGCQVAPLVSFVPEIAIFDLPMVFAQTDGDKIDEVLNGDSETHQKLSEAYETANFHLLGFLQNATFRLTTSNKDISTLDDFKGLKIRTMENANHMAFWTAIGASSTPLAWAEVYISLQNGAIDAEENAADTIVGSNLFEVQKYIGCTNHILYLNQLSMNKDSWNNLDPLYQKALNQAVEEAIAEMRPELLQIDTDNKKICEEKGMTIITYDDDFFNEVLNLQGVKDLYESINKDTNGLASIMQEELQ